MKFQRNCRLHYYLPLIRPLSHKVIVPKCFGSRLKVPSFLLFSPFFLFSTEFSRKWSTTSLPTSPFAESPRQSVRSSRLPSRTSRITVFPVTTGPSSSPTLLSARFPFWRKTERSWLRARPSLAMWLENSVRLFDFYFVLGAGYREFWKM